MLRRTFRRFPPAVPSSHSGAFDPFATLGLPTSANRDEVKQRYRELAMKYHPDSGTSANTDKMENINRAYNLLVKQGMVDQLRSVGNEAAAAKQTSGGMAGDTDSTTGAAGGDDGDPMIATLDPTTERISEDGSHFVYLDRATGRWVQRKTPLTKPRQPRYSTFQQEKQEVDLHEEIRKRQREQMREEQQLTLVQKRTNRWAEDAMPFNNKILVVLALVIYGWAMYLIWHRIMCKKNVWDDRRDLFNGKRDHRDMVKEAYIEFEDECDVAAEAAVLIFLAAALKAKDTDPIVPPTPAELTHKTPYFVYMLYNNM